MTRLEIEAHRLAQDIEVTRSRCAARKGEQWHYLYDPLAATELGNLIYKRMGPRTRTNQRESMK